MDDFDLILEDRVYAQIWKELSQKEKEKNQERMKKNVFFVNKFLMFLSSICCMWIKNVVNYLLVILFCQKFFFA